MRSINARRAAERCRCGTTRAVDKPPFSRLSGGNPVALTKSQTCPYPFVPSGFFSSIVLSPVPDHSVPLNFPASRTAEAAVTAWATAALSRWTSCTSVSIPPTAAGWYPIAHAREKSSFSHPDPDRAPDCRFHHVIECMGQSLVDIDREVRQECSPCSFRQN